MIKRSYKERQFLIFEFEDGKNVKYNLQTHECIGKSGKVVKSINNQFTKISYKEIINSFEVESYRNFLNYIDSVENRYYGSGEYCEGCKISNVGTFLKKIEDYNIYEQYFSAGIKNIQRGLMVKINDVPKKLIKLCRDYDLKFCEELLQMYNNYPSEMQKALEYICENNLVSIRRSFIYSFLISDSRGTLRKYKRGKGEFFELMEVYSYDIIKLIQYLDYLITFEGLENITDLICDLHDYARMMSVITKNSRKKFDKYPKHFLTTHNIVVRNFNRFKRSYQEEFFKRNIREDLEFNDKEFTVIYPKTTQDIKEEGVNLNHCVSSYIDNVINGECHILFLRKVKEPEKSLITLEVRNNTVVQSRGSYNRLPNEKEYEFIELYNRKIKKIK